MTSTRIAIMQPYFLPYLGYFRLLAATDLFVVYDCVQHIRRGWIHRNQLRTANRTLDWLTMPLASAPQDVTIDALRFSAGAPLEMAERMRRFPACAAPRTDHAERLAEAARAIDGTPVDYICRLLEVAASEFSITSSVFRSSTLNLADELRGQDRILAICDALSAKVYLNAPGGRDLYQSSEFSRRDIELKFLDQYRGPTDSILQRFDDHALPDLQAELRENIRKV